jgi:hypothetical protein
MDLDPFDCSLELSGPDFPLLLGVQPRALRRHFAALHLFNFKLA